MTASATNGHARFGDDPIALHDYRTSDVSDLPYSAQAEEAVIASVLKLPASIARVPGLLPDDFYVVKHRHVWRAMRALKDGHKPIDYHTVADELTKQGTAEKVGGLMYLFEIGIEHPTSAHIEYYATIVGDHAMRRRAISACQAVVEKAYAAALPISELRQLAKQQLADALASRRDDDTQLAEQWVNAYMEDWESLSAEGSLGISTGLSGLDWLTLGLSTGLYVLAGRPGMGKSELALQIARTVAFGRTTSGGKCRQGKGHVLYVSCEMDQKQLTERVVSQEAGVSKKRLIYGGATAEETEKLSQAIARLEKSRLAFAVVGSATSEDVADKARTFEAQNGKLDLLVVDHLQLLRDRVGEHQNRNYDLEHACHNLFALAQELDCTVLALSQVSRSSEGRDVKMPTLADLRDSGAIEQDCDVVLAIDRPGVRDADKHDKVPSPITEKTVHVCCRKNRRYGEAMGRTASLVWMDRFEDASGGFTPEYEAMAEGDNW